MTGGDSNRASRHVRGILLRPRNDGPQQLLVPSNVRRHGASLGSARDELRFCNRMGPLRGRHKPQSM